jgi:hypothetical protein
VLIPLAVLWVAGVVVAVPFVVWWARDFDRIPGRIWYWSGYDRRAWQWAVFLGFLAGGVIAIVTVLRWRRSDARMELLDELHERIAARDARVAEEARRAAARQAEQEEMIRREAEGTIDLREDAGPEVSNVRVLHDEPRRPLRVVPGSRDVAERSSAQ